MTVTALTLVLGRKLPEPAPIALFVERARKESSPTALGYGALPALDSLDNRSQEAVETLASCRLRAKVPPHIQSHRTLTRRQGLCRYP